VELAPAELIGAPRNDGVATSASAHARSATPQGPLILEHLDIAEPQVILQVQDALPEHLEDAGNLLGREPASVVAWRGVSTTTSCAPTLRIRSYRLPPGDRARFHLEDGSLSGTPAPARPSGPEIVARAGGVPPRVPDRRDR